MLQLYSALVLGTDRFLDLAGLAVVLKLNVAEPFDPASAVVADYAFKFLAALPVFFSGGPIVQRGPFNFSINGEPVPEVLVVAIFVFECLLICCLRPLQFQEMICGHPHGGSAEQVHVRVVLYVEQVLDALVQVALHPFLALGALLRYGDCLVPYSALEQRLPDAESADAFYALSPQQPGFLREGLPLLVLGPELHVQLEAVVDFHSQVLVVGGDGKAVDGFDLWGRGASVLAQDEDAALGLVDQYVVYSTPSVDGRDDPV